MKLRELLTELQYDDNPWEIMGVSREADDHSIETAYRQLLGKAATESQRNRLSAAYERIRSADRRARHELLSPSALAAPGELLYLIKAKPRFTGPGMWLRAIRELSAIQEQQEQSSAEA